MDCHTDLLRACEGDACLAPEQAEQVLDVDLPDRVWERVRLAADRRMRHIAKGRGRIYATVGVDAAPCAMNCAFCSHGAAWGKADARWELSVDDVCRRARELAGGSPRWFTLRTTQHYGMVRLLALCREVRRALPAPVGLIVNTGECTVAEANALADAGVEMAYHTFRLREGVDTGVRREDRLATLSALRASRLRLAALVEPIGPEHSGGELVEAAFRLREYGVVLGGAMARVSVEGTPLAPLGEVSEDRLVRAIAMARLVYDETVTDICVHPPAPAALRAGANTVVVESGAIPRDARAESRMWRQFGMADARRMLEAQGYRVDGGVAPGGRQEGDL